MSSEFKHIVYRFTFTEREKNGDFPFFYIGSKSNAVIKDNKIYDRHGNEYKTSSKDDRVSKLIDEGDYVLELLESTDDYSMVLQAEHDYHVECDVVNDVRYFNKSIAGVNVFTHPDYVTVKEFGQTRRVHRDYAKFHGLRGNTHGMNHWNDGFKNYTLTSDVDTTGLYEGRVRMGPPKPKRINPYVVTSKEEFMSDNPNASDEEWRSFNMGQVSKLKKSDLFIDQLRERMTTTQYLVNMTTLEERRVLNDEVQEYLDDGWAYCSKFKYEQNKITASLVKCKFCGFEGLENNASFHKWHNDNCKHNPNNTDTYTPWESEQNAYKLHLYAKYDIMHELLENNKTLSGIKVMKMFTSLSILPRDDMNDQEYQFIRRMHKKLKDGFNPNDSTSFKEFKEKYKNVEPSTDEIKSGITSNRGGGRLPTSS